MARPTIKQGNNNMSKTFKEMTKQELVSATEKFKLVDAVEAIAKDKSKITNAEYVTVLEEYKAKQDEVNSEAKESLEQDKKEVKNKPVPGPRKLTVDEQIAYLNTKTRVVITDHDNTLNIIDDSQNRRFLFEWGSVKLGGMKPGGIALDGKPQYVENGAIMKLKSLMYNNHTKDSAGNVVVKSEPRFVISEVADLTQNELDALAEKQRTRS